MSRRGGSHSQGRLPRNESRREGRPGEGRPAGTKLLGLGASGRLKNLVYVKIPKTGGSTFSGVVRRIGARRNYSHVRDDHWLDGVNTADSHDSRPSVWANHGKRSKLQQGFDNAMAGASFYITSVRGPADRFMSWYYHMRVGRGGAAASDADAKVNAIRAAMNRLETGYCALSRKNKQTAAEAFAGYDFVLVTERFDESLLALKKAAPWLELTLVDLLYLKAKESGKPATDTRQDARGAKMPEHVSLSEEPKAVRDALTSKFSGSEDESLVNLAHEALDKYGVANTSEYTEFQSMLRLVEERCRSHFDEDCFWNDNGCGQTCIDALATEQGWK